MKKFLWFLGLISVFQAIDPSKHIEINSYLDELAPLGQKDIVGTIRKLRVALGDMHNDFHDGNSIDHRQYEATYDRYLVAG
jgi:hypothetical protein